MNSDKYLDTFYCDRCKQSFSSYSCSCYYNFYKSLLFCDECFNKLIKIDHKLGEGWEKQNLKEELDHEEDACECECDCCGCECHLAQHSL